MKVAKLIDILQNEYNLDDDVEFELKIIRPDGKETHQKFIFSIVEKKTSENRIRLLPIAEVQENFEKDRESNNENMTIKCIEIFYRNLPNIALYRGDYVCIPDNLEMIPSELRENPSLAGCKYYHRWDKETVEISSEYDGHLKTLIIFWSYSGKVTVLGGLEQLIQEGHQNVSIGSSRNETKKP